MKMSHSVMRRRIWVTLSLAIALTSLAAPLPGQFVYVANSFSNNVSGYTINATTGALTAISGSPFAGGGGAIAVELAGKFVYVSNHGSDSVSGYTINATAGAVTPVSGSPFGGVEERKGVAVDPTGKFVYVTSVDSDV